MKITKGLIICAIYGLLFSSAAYAESKIIEAGVIFYKQGDFKNALKYLSEAVKANPTDVKAIYYFANSLLKTHNIDYAKKYYNKVIEMDPNSQYASYSRQAIQSMFSIAIPAERSMLKEKEIISSGNSYIGMIPKNVRYLVWRKDQMPLKVYVQRSKYPEYEAVIDEALTSWRKETDGVVSFSNVEQQEVANIRFYWNSDNETNSFKSPEGIIKPNLSGQVLTSYDIYLDIFDNSGKEISTSEVYSKALHALGHGLGISSHSDGKNDVMSASASVSKLSRRDRNTVLLLYNYNSTTSQPEQTIEGQMDIPTVEVKPEDYIKD